MILHVAHRKSAGGQGVENLPEGRRTIIVRQRRQVRRRRVPPGRRGFDSPICRGTLWKKR
ncbi:hypothetical protein, partial [Alienimonas chondri]|uniref:hypothetical protein n=1 Tax=Alienimonas chondri TaxID=2681879 RepID=UPI0019D51FDB